jgi:hypothetical protein
MDNWIGIYKYESALGPEDDFFWVEPIKDGATSYERAWKLAKRYGPYPEELVAVAQVGAQNVFHRFEDRLHLQGSYWQGQ